MGAIIGACAIATLLKEGSQYRINVMPTAFGCEYKDWLYYRVDKVEGEDDKIVDCRYDIQ